MVERQKMHENENFSHNFHFLNVHATMNSSRNALATTIKTSENTGNENKLKLRNFQKHFHFLSNFKFSTSKIGGSFTPYLPKAEREVIVL